MASTGTSIKVRQLLSRPQFDYAEDFSEGLAVAQKGKCGYINISGEFVIKPQFDFCEAFSDGLAQVGTGGFYLFGYTLRRPKRGFINTIGKFVSNRVR